MRWNLLVYIKGHESSPLKMDSTIPELGSGHESINDYDIMGDWITTFKS